MSLLSPVGEIVRRHDPDRYFTALFAPPEHRDTLFTLYAFNHELARAREAVREPYMALIRLQWWREVIEGARRRHEVAGPVGEALDEGQLQPEDLAPMIDAREAEADAIPDLAAFETYVLGAAGGVMVAAARALGMEQAEALRRPGAAYGIAGVLRSIEAHARQGRRVLPAGGDAAARALAVHWLASVPDVPRGALAAALPVVFARRDLVRDLGRPGGGARPLRDRLFVVAASVRGRV